MSKQAKKQKSIRTQWESLKNNKAYRIITYVMDAILVAYCLFVWLLIWFNNIPNLSLRVNKYMIYAVIPLCFFVSIMNINHLSILIGEGITIISDVFLILLGKTEIGMGVFIAVQIAYAIYFILQEKNKIRNIVMGVIRCFLTILLPILAKVVLKDKCNLTSIFAMIYFPNLVLNAIHAGLLKNWNLLVAFILFIGCDTCIGLTVLLPNDNPLVQAIHKFNFTHLFYIPSQLLIAMNMHVEARLAKNK